MVDDKDESAPDPWAGIDDDAAGQAGDGFTFSFDAASEITDAPGQPPEAEQAAVPFPIHAAEDMPDIPLEPAAEMAATDDPFAALAGDDDDAAAADDISSWLSEPTAESDGEPSLAVFPSEGVENGDDAIPGMAVADTPAADTMFEGISADDLHHESDGGLEPPMGSSHVEVGTGFSGIVSASGVDPTSGVMTIDDFATDDQPSFDASGFDGVSDLGEAAVEPRPEVDGQGLPAAGAAAVAAAVAAPRARPAARRQGGGIGQLIAIVLGGVMAIPITYAILIWGFQRDPFKLARMVPEQVAFLLPEKLQPGFTKSEGPTLDGRSALDRLPAMADAPAPVVEPEPGEQPKPGDEPEPGDEPPAPVADPAAGAVEGKAPSTEPHRKMPADAPAEPREPGVAATPPRPSDDFAPAPTRPAEPAAPPEPEPLDLAALEAAVGEASAAFDELTAADPEAPERRKLLVAWYKRLAAAAEQLVLVEKVAMDSGRGFGEASAAIDPLSAAIAADATVQGDLARLSGMWLGSKKRAADGAVLLATFDGARKVGPYWSMLITVAGAEPLTVNAISRAEPQAEPGERVLVTGVVFDGDVVWATDCRPLARKPAPSEDPF